MENVYMYIFTLLRDQLVEFEEVNFSQVIRNHIYYFENFSQLRHYQHIMNTIHLELLDHDRVFPKEI